MENLVAGAPAAVQVLHRATMAACHFLSISSHNAMSELPFHWDNQTHSSLQRATSLSSRVQLTTVLHARKPKAESVVRRKTLRLEPLAPASEEKGSPSSEDMKSENLLYEGFADFEYQHGYPMSSVCDRLIEVFMLEKTEESEWRKLLMFSEDWDKIRPHFFKRCKYRQNLEPDTLQKANLLSLSKKLEKVDVEMEQHNQLLHYVKENWPELDVIVAGRRKDFNDDFFHHVTLLSDVLYNRTDKRDDLARIAAKCLSAVEAHDRALEDDVAVTVAQQKFEEILDSPSFDVACSKIDELAKKKQLDSTLMLLFTKSWAEAEKSTTMTDELKDLMHHLYMVARGHLQRMIPKEIRILKHILAIEDPTQRFAALTEAFTPGDESLENNRDLLYTKPARLQKWIKLVLDGYHLNKQNTVMKSARELTNPEVITCLRQLKEIMEEHFL